MSISPVSAIGLTTPSTLPGATVSAADFAGLLSGSGAPANANAFYRSGQLGLQLNAQGKPATIVYYDAKGGELDRGAFTPEQILSNVDRLSIPMSNLADLASTLDSHGVTYKPGEMFAGQYGAGIDLKNLSEGGMGTAFDWTQDANVALKGPSAAVQLAASQALAVRLGVSRTYPTETAITPIVQATPAAQAVPAADQAAVATTGAGLAQAASPIIAASTTAATAVASTDATPAPSATASDVASATTPASGSARRSSSHRLDLLLASQSQATQTDASDASRAYARRMRSHHG